MRWAYLIIYLATNYDNSTLKRLLEWQMNRLLFWMRTYHFINRFRCQCHPTLTITTGKELQSVSVSILRSKLSCLIFVYTDLYSRPSEGRPVMTQVPVCFTVNRSEINKSHILGFSGGNTGGSVRFALKRLSHGKVFESIYEVTCFHPWKKVQKIGFSCVVILSSLTEMEL